MTKITMTDMLNSSNGSLNLLFNINICLNKISSKRNDYILVDWKILYRKNSVWIANELKRKTTRNLWLWCVCGFWLAVGYEGIKHREEICFAKKNLKCLQKE